MGGNPVRNAFRISLNCHKIRLFQNESFTCLDTYEKGTGFKSQKCPLHLGAARVTMTAAARLYVMGGKKDNYCDGITGLNSCVA